MGIHNINIKTKNMERAAGGGSAAVVIKPPKKTQQEEAKREVEEEGPIIRFVVRPRNNVKFAVGTVDNEGMGKRKSKVCCIFNKPHTLDESSSDSGADSCDSHHEKNRYDRLPKHQRKAMREQQKKKDDAEGGEGVNAEGEGAAGA